MTKERYRISHADATTVLAFVDFSDFADAWEHPAHILEIEAVVGMQRASEFDVVFADRIVRWRTGMVMS